MASFLSPVDISAFLAAKSKPQGETLRLFHFIFEADIMEKRTYFDVECANS